MNRWWLLPSGILVASVLLALGVVVFQPPFMERSSSEAIKQATSEPTQMSKPPADCSGARAADYSCYEERYQELVHDSGVKAAFDDLKDEYTKDEFVKSNCHQLTHVIGRAALDLYDDLSTAYGHGDDFCAAGYYHGATEAAVAKLGPDKILDEAGTICADLGEHQEHSFYHYNCAHGLGHGFMGALQNELFEALRACDALTDEWEKDPCYAGVFMQNTMAQGDPSHPSKYLKPDQPLYPCTEVESRYKNECYKLQTSYALQMRGNDFAKVFDLCQEVEGDSQPACYQGLGGYAAVQSIQQNATDVAQDNFTKALCMLGVDYEAWSNCVVGAVKYFILDYHDDAQAKALCNFFDADLHTVCLQTTEEFYKGFQT